MKEENKCEHKWVCPTKVFILDNFDYGISIMYCLDCDSEIGFDYGEIKYVAV